MKNKLIIFSGLLLVSTYLFGEDWQAFPIGPFSGLNNRDNSFAIPNQNAQDLLNVEITPGGKSVKKRKGYASEFTLTNSTSAIHGTYIFFDSNGNDVALFFNDTYLSASVSGNTPTVLFSTGPNGATYQCTDSLGFAYCANTSRTTLLKVTGSTSQNIVTVASTGSIVAACPTRLAMAGFGEAPSRIDFSASADFTSWGTGALGSSPVQITVSAPGYKITHLVYAFGRLMWFKDTSFGFIMIGSQPNQTDWLNQVVSYDVGTNDNTSVFREGILYFRGKDGHIYAYDGVNYKRLSREISGTIGSSQLRTSGAWTATTQADFEAGVSTPMGWATTTLTPGAIQLATATAIANFSDSSDTDFGLGTLVTVSSTASPGNLLFVLSTGAILNLQYGADSSEVSGCENPGGQIAQSFTSSSDFYLTSITLRLDKNGSPADTSVAIYSDAGGTTGSRLATASLPASSVSTSLSDVTVTISTLTIAGGVRYWVVLFDSSGCSNLVLKRINWEVSNGSFTEYLAATGHPNDTAANAKYKLIGKQYPTSGSFTSRSFDTGFSTASWLWQWSTFSPVVSASSITFTTQVSSSTNGPWDTAIAVTNGGTPGNTAKEFFRYVATFVGTTLVTPQLDSVSIAMSPRLRPSTTWYSPIVNAPNITSWNDLEATINNFDIGTQNFFIRAATNTFSVQSSTPTWGAVTRGGIPSISTGTFFQVKDEISARTFSSITNNPTLFDVTQNWFEGVAGDKTYATYFDDKILFSIAYGTGVSVNNRLLVFDMLNQTWLFHDIPVNGFYVRNNALHFGSSGAGKIFKFGDIDNDNTSAISAYWKSKDFFGADPFSTQEIANISIVSKQVSNSSMTVTYTLNGSTFTSFVANLSSQNSNFTSKNKNLPAGTIGSEFSVKFGNNAADQPFEVFGIQVGIREKPWIPTP